MSTRLIRFLKLNGEENRARLTLNLLIGACTLLTCGAMYSGLAALGEAGPVESWVALGITVAIAVSLTYSIHNFFRARGFRARSVWLAGWGGLAFISVVMGYGLYFDLLSAKTLARENVTSGVSTAVRPMVGFRVTYGQLSAAAADLASYSRQRADEEIATGGTCGGAPQPNEGPRRRLRVADAATFDSFAQHFARQVTRVDANVAAAEAAASNYHPSNHRAAVASVERAFTEAKFVAADPRLREWNALLARRIAQGTQAFTDASSGGTFSCPDTALEARMRGASNVALPRLPERLPEIMAPTHAASVQRGLGIVTGDVSFDRRVDLLPFLFGALMDVILTLFICTKLMRFGGFGSAGADPSGLEGIRNAFSSPPVLGALGGQLDEGLAMPRWAFLDLLDKWSVTIGRRMLVAVPRRSSTAPDAPTLRALVAVLGSSQSISHKFRTTTERLPRQLRACVEHALATAEEVDVFELPAQLLNQLETDNLRSWVASSEAASHQPDAADAADNDDFLEAAE